MGRRRTRANTLTLDEATTALYIDFEGGKHQPPVLLGSTRRAQTGGRPRAMGYIVDPVFAPLADADDFKVMSLADAVELILQRAVANRRLIVAWSTYEHDMVERYVPEHLALFDEWFVNGKLVAERWMSRCHLADKPASGKLADYLAYIGRNVPERAGPDRTGETIGRIRRSLEHGRGVAGLTADQGQRWRDLLEHNAHDCAGLKEIMLRATHEMASLSGQATPTAAA